MGEEYPNISVLR